jgi:hypothetical protein
LKNGSPLKKISDTVVSEIIQYPAGKSWTGNKKQSIGQLYQTRSNDGNFLFGMLCEAGMGHLVCEIVIEN